MNQTVFGDTSATGFDVDARTRKADAQPLAEVAWTELLRPWFSWIVGGWLIGVLLCSLRPLLGWRMLRRLRRIGISPPSDDVLAAFTRVSQQLGLRRAVKVFHSTLATGPLVVGYLKPVVLLPVSLVTSIPLSQLEAILAHELAHIRRHDFIINLFQTLMETLFFYHPAIWWLSRRIRIEREHCCDDLVVKLFNNGVDYGRALLAIEQLQSQRTVLALGAADGSLLGRIRRISGSTSHQSRFIPWLATPIALSVVCGMWMAGQELIYGASDEQANHPDSIAIAADDNSSLAKIGEFEVLLLRKDETRTMESSFRFRRAEGFSSETVSVGVAQTPKQLRVIGKSIGLTLLKLTDENGDQYLIPVEVVEHDVKVSTPVDAVFRITSANLLPKHLSDVESELTLVAGGSIELEFPWLVAETKESDRAIIQTTAVNSKHRLSVKGIAPGNATLRVFNASITDRQERQIEVEVLPLTRENILAVFGKSKKIEAKLSDGMSIELLGISTPPIELTLNDKREWWKGDGTKMEVSPIPRSSISVGASESDGREFVVRAANLAGQVPMDVTLKERFKDGQLYKPDGNGWSQSSTHSGPINENQKDKWQVTSEYVAGPVGDTDSATLEVRVGSGVAAEMLFDVKGQRSNGDSKDDVWQLAAVKKMAERVEVLRTGPHESGFAIWTKPFSSTTDEGTLDVTLIDASGQRHNRFTSGSDGNEAYHVFEIQPDDIDKFVVRLRPYQYVATFENVSLKPGNKSDVRVTVASLPEEKTPVAAASESKDPKPVAFDASDAAQVAHYTGVVKDDKGQPLAGARIYILPFASGKKDPGPVRATTDKNGLFEFDAPDMTYPKYDGTPALYDGLLMATKEGYGPDSFHTWGNRNDGLRDWTTPVKGAKIDLQLAKDDVPVRGRLLDPEGKPLVRANVNIEAIGLPIKFNLDTHLKAEAEADIGRGFLTGAKVYERSLGRPELVPDLITQLQTDADGRFEITGVGHERLVTLSVRHSSIQDARIEVMSRVAPDVGTIRDFEGKATSTLHGSGFTRQMSPGLTLTGIVRDRRSKAPISSMWVTIFGDPVKYAYYNRNPAVTDANGRFTISGLNPVYATQAIEKRDIAAYPQPGIPYLMAKALFTSNEETIIECEPGIPFRLKVVDEIGRPVEGGVFYRPITPNPMIEELVKPLRGNSFDGVSMRALRRDDGTYEGFVLPGPGAIVFDATQRYVFGPALVDPKAFFEPLRMDWPANSETIYGTGDTLATIFQSNDPQTRHEAIVLVNPPDDSKPLELKATVLKDRPRQVSLIDPEGKPVAGVDSRMRWPDRETNEALNSATFMLRGLHPDRVKQMTFFHKERNLTGILLARGDSDEPMTVILQPSAVVTGRLSFQDGKPRNNFYLAMRATDEGVDVLRLGELGRDGIFRIEGLIPGLSFSSVNSGNVLRFVSLEGKPVENLILKPGEVRDVGERARGTCRADKRGRSSRVTNSRTGSESDSRPHPESGGPIGALGF